MGGGAEQHVGGRRCRRGDGEEIEKDEVEEETR